MNVCIGRHINLLAGYHRSSRFCHATMYTMLQNRTNMNQLFESKRPCKVYKADMKIQRFLSEKKPIDAPLTTKDKFKKAVTEYGSTVVVFHVTISLISLGTCYFLISNGVDVGEYIVWLGFSDATSGKFASNAGTFVAAYAVHKIFAPVRMGITIGATPFIVKYLRNKGLLKKSGKT